MYKKIYKPDHPKADVTGCVSEHILIMEEQLGRPLKKTEVVHHSDFDKTNNKFENLILMTRGEHQRMPEMQAKFLHSIGMYDDFLNWWVAWKNDIDEEQVIRIKIIEQENKIERMKGREAKRRKS